MDKPHYPEAEAKLPWLGQLMETYRRTDKIIREDLASSKRKIACKEGCSACCKNIKVPINKVEMAGISWFIVDNLKREARMRIIDELEKTDRDEGSCPFLIDTKCGIYAVRPLACRTFYLHGEPCLEDENIFEQRENDFHRFPVRKLQKAARPLLSALGVNGKTNQLQSIGENFLMEQSRPMLSINWRTFILNNVELRDSIAGAIDG